MTSIVPPLDTSIAPYELQIIGPRIDEEREVLTDIFRRRAEDDSMADLRGLAERFVTAFSSPELSAAFTKSAPFVEHFLSTELDIQSPRGPGIGLALGGNKQDVRFGSRFAKGLRTPESRLAVGVCFERMILVGFMGQLVAGEVTMVPPRRYGPDTTVLTSQIYEEWIKYFPSMATQIFLKTSGALGGSRGDASAEMYDWTALFAVYEYEKVCDEFRIKGKFGKGGRESFTYLCFAAGWLLGFHLSEEA